MMQTYFIGHSDLVVRTNHLDVNRIFAISGLTKDGSHR